MKVIRHDIDPDGDLLIVLKRPNSLNLMPHLPMDDFPWPPPHYGSILVDLSNKDDVQIEFRVFSLLMLRSSMFFRKMLTSPWKETVEASTASPRLLRVSATDWNADALAVVIDIIHDRSYWNDIPHGLSNFFLAHIAAIVDYYQCAECPRIKAVTKQWESGFRFDIGMNAWITNLYIALVFSWKSFRSTIVPHVLEKSHDLTRLTPIYDLPMGETLRTIENKRQAILGKLLARIDAMAPGIWEDRTDCSDECYLSIRRRLPTVFPRLPVSRSLIGCSIAEVLSKIDDLLPAHEYYHGGDCGVNSMMYEATWEMYRDVRQASYEIFKDTMQ
ncbi:hypothetical protein FCULG_00002859 [Fusarium culmorum]|uniref:BTB domain-containing protein n=1 Tax=Fusarium culmorum TaxID=5516 RepID=A0A2T4HA60_FUSCU|nr:hypothetical protein FCULG_00002859 [Fusarium culmorum]